MHADVCSKTQPNALFALCRVNAINPDTEGTTDAATLPDSGKTPFLSPTHDFIRGHQHCISTEATALVMDLQAINEAVLQEAAYTWTPDRFHRLLSIRSRTRESTLGDGSR